MTNPRRTKLNKQAKQRKDTIERSGSVVMKNHSSVGKGRNKNTTHTKGNNRKSGKVITINTSNKSYRRGTRKKTYKRLPMTSWLLKPIVTYFTKR